VVVSIVPDEYSILWSGRGLTKYKRSILDVKLEQIFQRIDAQAGLPKERHLSLGPSSRGVAFNENYDRAKIALLCEKLKLSNARNSKDLAEGLTAQLLSKKLTLRDAAKALLLELAELCKARGGAGEEARNISRELFFGYVLQKSDFHQPDAR
jgi:hypothetical protein